MTSEKPYSTESTNSASASNSSGSSDALKIVSSRPKTGCSLINSALSIVTSRTERPFIVQRSLTHALALVKSDRRAKTVNFRRKRRFIDVFTSLYPFGPSIHCDFASAARAQAIGFAVVLNCALYLFAAGPCACDTQHRAVSYQRGAELRASSRLFKLCEAANMLVSGRVLSAGAMFKQSFVHGL